MLASSHDDVIKQMTFSDGEPREFYRFLHKFELLNWIEWSPDTIQQAIDAVCAGIADEHIDYCFLDISLNKYLNVMRVYDLIPFIYEAFQKHGKVGLILSIKYEADSVDCLEIINSAELAKCFVGIDLVGDEAKFDAQKYVEAFRLWRSAGKMTRAHVGESQSADNILDALVMLECTNIAHGLKIIDHPDLIDIALKRNVVFDLGITSNYLTGVWHDEYHHPLVEMLEHGLAVTIGTDDPIQCATNLNREFALTQWFGVSENELDKIRQAAESMAVRYGAI